MNTALTAVHSQPIVSQANSDDQLIALWLHGKSEHSQRAYLRDAEDFMAHSGKLLPAITLGDLQSWMDSLTGAESSRNRKVSAVKSLLSFGHRVGYLPMNIGAAVKAPKVKNKLAERILTEDEVLRMIHQTDKQRDRVLLRVLYASAGRVSEVVGLRWRDVKENGDSGQVTLFGKGGDTRVIKLSIATWNELQAIQPEHIDEDMPVFVSQKGGSLDQSQVNRIVKAAGQRAGITGSVSPHWLRHSHASHALDRGASVALVRDTLGHSSVAITSKYLHAKPGESSALHLAV